MPTRGTHAGALLIVGGHEDKEGPSTILRALVRRLDGRPLLVATLASEEPDALWATYDPLFQRLGVDEVRHLAVSHRDHANAPETVALFDGAGGVFFTGGDQLRITSLLGGTESARRLHSLYAEGGIVAGTSAGASMMSGTMLVGGAGAESYRIGDSLQMAPGLGLLPGAIVDQHFAERGRIGRLLGAVAQNPATLGIGIDENTAILVEGTTGAQTFRVLGAGAVTVADGSSVTYSNVADEARDRTLSLFDVRLHLLSQGDAFDLASRRPRNGPAEEVERWLGLDAADDASAGARARSNGATRHHAHAGGDA